jgi:hypothetical protein
VYLIETINNNTINLNQTRIESQIPIERKYMRKIWIALLMMAPCVFAEGNENSCREVSGGIVTNFLGSPVVGSRSLGTATGDLRGGLGVVILGISTGGPNGSTVFHVQHYWVTETGDTISLADAYATAYPTGVPGVVAVTFPNGISITGGTGRFAGATGNIVSWGAVNLNTGEVVQRYEGTICFTQP